MKNFFYKRNLMISNILLLVVIVSICCILSYNSYHSDIYPALASEGYTEAGLKFFYSLPNTATELWMIIVILALPSNMLPYQLLVEKNNRFSYQIKTRIGSKNYLNGNKIKVFLNVSLSYFIILIILLLFIHFFLVPINFIPDPDRPISQTTIDIFNNSHLVSLIIYLVTSSIGMGVYGCFIYSLKNLFKNNYYYRGFSLIVGIVLIALPAVIGVKLYQIVPSDIVFNICSVFFLPTLVTPGVQGFGSLGFVEDPLLGFLLSVCMYTVITGLINLYMDKKEYKNE